MSFPQYCLSITWEQLMTLVVCTSMCRVFDVQRSFLMFKQHSR